MWKERESQTPQCCSAVVVWTRGRWRLWGVWILLSSASRVVEETTDPSTHPHTLSPATLLQVCVLLSEQHNTTENNLWILLSDYEHQKSHLPRSHLTKTLRPPTLHSPHDPPQLLCSLSQVTKTHGHTWLWEVKWLENKMMIDLTEGQYTDDYYFTTTVHVDRMKRVDEDNGLGQTLVRPAHCRLYSIQWLFLAVVCSVAKSTVFPRYWATFILLPRAVFLVGGLKGNSFPWNTE